jgi:ketosteroid isomerase-like protein
MQPLALAICLLLSVTAVCQSGPCTEKSINDQRVKRDAPSVWADDAYFYSHAVDKPLVGKASLDESMKAVGAKRKNEKYDDHVERTVISPNGDMAYEYGTTHIVFDTDNQHRDFTALFLRVWKAADGQCKVAAFMAQPAEKK